MHKRIALRARIKSEQIELTLKQEADVGIIETSDIITYLQLDQILNQQELPKGDVSNKLFQIGVTSPLYEFARITTNRYEFPYKDNLIALDQSIYEEHIDYEIELETKDYEYGKKIFEALLDQFKIKRRKTKHKVIRAYEYKKASN